MLQSQSICLLLMLSVSLHQVPSPRDPWYLVSEEDKECCCSHNRCRLEQPLAGDTHRDDGFVVLRYVGTVTIYTGTQLCSPAYLHALKVANGKYWLIGIA